MTVVDAAPEVLILAPDHDVHAIAVGNALIARGCAAELWDTSALPANDRLSFDPGGSIYLQRSDGSAFDIREVGKVWWRRPRMAEIPDEVTDTEVRAYCKEECRRLLLGLGYALGESVINSLHAQTRADSKPYQLNLARQMGLLVPETRITNNPDELESALSEGSWVVKPLRSPDWKLVETRLLDASYCDFVDHLHYGPVILQRAILGGRDIRATVVGEQIFCACLDPNTRLDHVDSRLDFTSPWIDTTIPSALEAQLVQFVAELGLQYGAIDLKEDADGQLYFLEINPTGQFLFAEVDSGASIVNAFADLLFDESRAYKCS